MKPASFSIAWRSGAICRATFFCRASRWIGSAARTRATSIHCSARDSTSLVRFSTRLMTITTRSDPESRAARKSLAASDVRIFSTTSVRSAAVRRVERGAGPAQQVSRTAAMPPHPNRAAMAV